MLFLILNQKIRLKKLTEIQGKEIDGKTIKLNISNSKPEVKPEVTITNNERVKNIGDVRFRPSDNQFNNNLGVNADRDKRFSFFKPHGFLKNITINRTFSQLKRWCLLSFQHVHKVLHGSNNN